MKLTVLIANHNYGRYIYKCIESICNQTLKPDRIVVVDDASTDNSLLEVDRAAKNIQSKVDIVVISLKENVGPSAARNVGIERFIDGTDYFLIVDADDEIYPNKLEELVKVMQNNPGIGVVYADYDILNENTEVLLREYKPAFSTRRLMSECIVHSGSLISSEALQFVKDEHGYYDERMRTCEDYDLWLRISRNYGILHVPKSLTLVLDHSNNSTNSVDKNIWQRNWSLIREKLNVNHTNI